MMLKKNLHVTSDIVARACRAAASRSCLGMDCEVSRVVCVLSRSHVGVDVVLIESEKPL